MITMNSFESVVADIKLESRVGLHGTWWISLDVTEFVPGDTGVLKAVTRSGTKLEIDVNSVTQDAEGVVWHVVEKPLAAGTDVTGTVAVRDTAAAG